MSATLACVDGFLSLTRAVGQLQSCPAHQSIGNDLLHFSSPCPSFLLRSHIILSSPRSESFSLSLSHPPRLRPPSSPAPMCADHICWRPPAALIGGSSQALPLRRLPPPPPLRGSRRSRFTFRGRRGALAGRFGALVGRLRASWGSLSASWGQVPGGSRRGPDDVALWGLGL